jgi:hypothetical protein
MLFNFFFVRFRLSQIISNLNRIIQGKTENRKNALICFPFAAAALEGRSDRRHLFRAGAPLEPAHPPKSHQSESEPRRPEWGMHIMHMLQIAIGKLKSSNLNTFFSPFCTNCTIKHEFTQKKNIFQQ